MTQSRPGSTSSPRSASDGGSATRTNSVVSIDSRIGSAHLRTPLRKLGLTTKLTKLAFGDVDFPGVTGWVGIELKKVEDLAASLTSGRLAGHQVPGMRKNYAHCYLIIEGLFRPNPKDGMLESFRFERRCWRPTRIRSTYAQLDRFLCTIEMEANFHIRRSMSGWETAVIINDLYRWHQKKEHKSLQVYNKANDVRTLGPMTQVEAVAATLPGVGWTRAKAVADRFETVIDMCRAPSQVWEKIEGIGRVTAKKAVMALLTPTEVK